MSATTKERFKERPKGTAAVRFKLSCGPQLECLLPLRKMQKL